jgi:hypothetical protein
MFVLLLVRSGFRWAGNGRSATAHLSQVTTGSLPASSASAAPSKQLDTSRHRHKASSGFESEPNEGTDRSSRDESTGETNDDTQVAVVEVIEAGGCVFDLV